ncbi:MBL fold metallo-hydrolase [Burkholderia anthina]|uniref:MBL fold metallo-hydrolase n=1 Tax=Burkholderia anthina TaxID=179879 RepID=A0A6P2GBT6_9BURK|nr:MBL fold metallo-hydrolase [Burkholderia anthina]MBM2766305.1 MBL fold metallo-hydrolase [Burkholderia anthina]VVU50454.1 zinc-dependent hydrolase [Burkholderia anthina]
MKNIAPLRIDVETFDWPLAARLAASAQRRATLAPGVSLYWLGQAGFVIEGAGLRLLIDPYLSDSLARKYRNTRYPHERMMAAPITPDDLEHVDLVLCTHRHTDHMDPDTLQPLARRFPALRFVVPTATLDEAVRRCGVETSRLIAVDAGQCVEPLSGVRILPIASAHETLDVDAQGRHPWLGYVIEIAGVRLYHSGDCVPYTGLSDSVAAQRPHVALLPVNGRDDERSSNGVPGNFTLDEAVSLARDAGVRVMIAHHHGLFDFNTIAPDEIDARILSEGGALALYRARTQCMWHVCAHATGA